jgi:hypothetical protein
MSEIHEIDAVLQSVRQSVRHYGLFAEGAVGQQILLLGDSFYGYRFTAKEFTAIWSATDQILKIFDSNGQCLGNSLLNTHIEPFEGQGAIRLSPYQVRKAA